MAGGANFGARVAETTAYVCNQDNTGSKHKDFYCIQERKEKLDGTLPLPDSWSERKPSRENVYAFASEPYAHILLRQAEELAHFAQSTELETRERHLGRELVKFIKNGRKDARTCYKCGKTGHIKATSS